MTTPMPVRKPPAADATLTALYKAVLANPDDDLPRLVYADRLDELGDHPRAEFIRLQCHVSATNPWDEGHADAAVRSEVLYERHEEVWGVPELERELMRSKGVGPGIFRPFVRGFPEVTWASIEGFSAAHRKALKKYPIRELVLVDGTPSTIHLVGKFINEVGARTVHLPLTQPIVFAALANGPVLPTVRKLIVQVSDTPTAEEVGRLAACDNFPNVEVVQLKYELDEELLVAFVSHLRWPSVREVKLNGMFTLGVVEVLAGAEWLAGVNRLFIEHSQYDEPHDLARLFRSPYTKGLRVLDVDGLAFGPEAVRALATPERGPLERFDPHTYDLSTRDFRKLLTSPALATVRSIDITGVDNADADKIAELIGRNGELRQLKWGGRDFPAKAVAAMASSAASQSLRRWSMDWKSLDGPTVAALTSNLWPNLAELEAGFGKHDGREVAKLIDSPHLARLTHLNAAHVTKGGIRAGELWRKLAKSKTVGRFHKLRLGFPITDAQLNALLDNPEVCKIGHLALPNRVKIGRKTQRRYEKVFGVRITQDY